MNKKEYNQQMSTLVTNFVDSVTNLTRDMAREAVLGLFEDDGKVSQKHAEKALKQIERKTRKATKKVANKTVRKIERKTEKSLKRRQKDAKRAWYLRDKLKKGADLKKDDAAWLNSYNAKNPVIERKD